ncbi:hypothetical protein ACLQ22_13240 [Micromonospora sp. DT178]|uniref:hypothetical protein n=1 Tax=unclassified Micromonospora TaxID=2617518 RepID=UPI000F16667B|nr:hypothetical protein [Micromonospora sp. M71_S20]RLK12167.1 hypothetical protein DER29_5444 [Micromonospora sp. M71_S20]
MFGNDADFILSIHRTHAAELHAEAAVDRLARALPRRTTRDWLSRRHHPGRAGDARR